MYVAERSKSENEHMPRLEDEFLEMTRSVQALLRANLSEILKRVRRQKGRQDQEEVMEMDADIVGIETIEVTNQETTREKITTM